MKRVGMDPVHDTRTVFQSVMNAMSRPGTVHEVPVTPADHAVLATLVDHEVTLNSNDERICAGLAAEGRLTEASLTDADIVHITPETDVDLGRAKQGTRKEPSIGATVVYCVQELSTSNGSPSATLSATTIELSGPGVNGSQRIDIAGLSTRELQTIREGQADYPRGIDVIMASDSCVAALPRSVELEVT